MRSHNEGYKFCFQNFLSSKSLQVRLGSSYKIFKQFRFLYLSGLLLILLNSYSFITQWLSFFPKMLASMKQQFVELLSDIGFVKEGIVVRDVERAARGGSDGVVDVTGIEVVHMYQSHAIKHTTYNYIQAFSIPSFLANGDLLLSGV